MEVQKDFEADLMSSKEEASHNAVDDQVLQEELIALRKKIEEQELQRNDLVLRHAAEMANMQMRHGQMLESSKKFALEKFLKAILPILDSLEQAKSSSEALGKQEEHLNLQQGIFATLQLLENLLQGENVTAINPQQVPFDPLLHHAMNTTNHPELPHNCITHVYQKGYLLSNRLLRPAVVSVNVISE